MFELMKHEEKNIFLLTIRHEQVKESSGIVFHHPRNDTLMNIIINMATINQEY